MRGKNWFYTEFKVYANLIVSPDDKSYQFLKDYLFTGLMFKMDAKDFYVANWEIKNDNLNIWFEEVE